MKSIPKLPSGYRKIYEVDMQKNKKIFWLLQLFSTLIAVALIVPAHFYVPIISLFDLSAGYGPYMLRFGVLLGAAVVYLVLHEAVHGIAMKMCGTKKVRYGFTGAYAFAASDDYYAKGAYIFIALAPVLLWGIVLAVIVCLASAEWFWVVYLIQVINLSGAVGDFFVTLRLSRFRKDIWVRDYGVGMTVYAKQEKASFLKILKFKK